MTPFLQSRISGLFNVLIILCCLPGLLVLSGAGAAQADFRIEKKTLALIRQNTKDFAGQIRACNNKVPWQVYLIDNFEQTVRIIPEVTTTHGEMIKKLLQSGRNDIDILVLNTALSKGLAMVIQDLVNGGCTDAVVSSTPGSNYTYSQVSTLLPQPVRLTPENILDFRNQLRQLLRNIAFEGFPSVKWLEQIDVNAAKLKNDAIKFVFIEALDRFNVPVFLPYGNPDTTHKGELKTINLLSLAENAGVYSALDQNGERMAGYPYSPLSSGDEQAVYTIVECPHPDDPYRSRIDINEDGFYEYEYLRNGPIVYQNARGHLSYAPPVLNNQALEILIKSTGLPGGCDIEIEFVVTVDQFIRLKKKCPTFFTITPSKQFVWVNHDSDLTFFEFNAACRERGHISGTSVIPPQKVKKRLSWK